MTRRMIRGGLLASLCTVAFATSANAATFTNPTPIGPGDAPPVQSVSPITVSGLTGTVSKVKVTLNEHSMMNPGHIDSMLVGPGGQKTMVMSDACGVGSFLTASLTFADGLSPIPTNCGMNVTAGSFGPTDVTTTPADAFDAPAPPGPYPASFAGFNGTAPNGTWTLYTTDDTAGDLMFNALGWTLDIETAPPVAVTPPVATTAPKCPKGKKLKKVKGKKKCVRKKKKKK